MIACKDVQVGKTPRTVIRGVNSQKSNEVGVHWARISFDRRYLRELVQWSTHFFGKSQQDGLGLWSYDSREYWPSGVQLNFDNMPERSRDVHNGRMTLECPGKALDELTQADLTLFLEGCRRAFCGVCKRIDVFLDDYNKAISPSGLHSLIKRRDYSGLRKWHIAQTGDPGRLTHDEVSFGRRGEKGSGKYIRVYDKALESNGERDCIRWEVEFTQEKAQQVFVKIAETGGDIEAFATLCGSLVAGAINFVKRTGDKNIGRLDVYDFWLEIRESMGTLVVRTEKKINSLTGMFDWTERQVAPTLACLRRCFRGDQKFFNWLFDILERGDHRMNSHKTDLAEKYESSFSYNRNCSESKQLTDYIDIISGQSF